jgi:hypothetical protein
LLEIIKTLLGTELPDNELSDVRIKVAHQVGVQNGETPSVALYLGGTRINQTSMDTQSSAVRPQEQKDLFFIDVNTPQGPYKLSKTPLEGSITCRVFNNEGLVGERQRLMLDKKDFTIDYVNKHLAFSTSLVGAGTIHVDYLFPGVFTIKEFTQEFFIDVFNNPIADSERLTAVVNAVVLTNHDAILANFNELNRTQHSIGKYKSEHTLRSFHCLDMTPLDSEDSPSIWSLKYEAFGLLKVIKEIDGGYGIIQKVVSSGRVGEGVDVVVNIE